VQHEGARELLLVMADLPYLAAADIAAMIEAGRTSDVVIAEAKDGGTNALLLRPADGAHVRLHHGPSSAPVPCRPCAQRGY
jgi:2-phospho-L-lactate guanylyltransferase (CobY/MobA/RfbA family)